MKTKKLFHILGFLVFYLILSPLCVYSSSNLELIAYLLFIFLILSYKKKCNLCNRYTSYERQRTILLFIIAFIIPSFLHVQVPFTTDFLQWWVIIVVISLRNECREQILTVSVKLFSLYLLIAIVEYLLNYVGGKPFVISVNNINDIQITQTFVNLYRYGNFQYRFSALSNEPGALGAICGFVLAFLPVNKKNIFPIVVSLIGGLLTLSLAFYLYLAFILGYKSIKGEIKLRYTFIIIVLLFCTLFLFRNEVHNAIVLRLTENEQLDNRSSEMVNEFCKRIFETSDGIYGVGNRTAYLLQEDSGEGNAGLKWKLFQYGIVGCGSYFIAMLLLYNKNRNKSISYWFGICYYLMYFYAVGMWGVPLFILLLFTTPQKEISNQLESI